MQHILITGGAGYIGAHVNALLAQHLQTIVYDNLSRGDRHNVLEGTFIQGDLADKKALSAVFKKFPIDAVLHFAASTDVGESVAHPNLYYQNNVVNTLTLLETMRHFNVNTFVFSSSAAVYGIPATERVVEDSPCSPINPYGETKWMVEKILHDFSIAYGLRYCALRYFNAAGGDPNGKIKQRRQAETNLIPILLRCVREKKPATIFGTDYPTVDGTCIRDYIHVMDLASAHWLALKALWKGQAAPCYNLGNGRGFSVREVIASIQEITALPLPIIEGPRRPGDPPILLADASKALFDLQWRPQYPSLHTIIQDAWRAYNG